MKFILSFAAVALVAANLSHASLNGLDSGVLGDRSSDRVLYSTWDLFPSAVIDGLAGQAGDLGAGLSQSVVVTSPYGPQPGAVANDLFYTFTKATDWTISATAPIDINTAVLQLKFSPPASGMPVTEYFTMTLNGIAATPVVTGSGIDVGGMASSGYSVLQWTWSNLDLASGESLQVHFSSPAGSHHVALDSLSLDASAVPEPSTYAVGMVAVIGVIVWRRRRASLPVKN